MTIDPVELERLSKAATQEDDDVRYYGGPTSTHRPARDAYHAALVQLHRTGQLVPAMPSGDVVEAVARKLAPFMEGGREYDQMPATRRELKIWSRNGMALINDATQDDAQEAATAAITAYEAVSGVAKMREDVASLVTAATAVRNACLGTPVGGGDGGTYVPGHPTMAELNNLTAAIIACELVRAALGEQP